MAEEEDGAEFNPYGGKIHFNRISPTGPVGVNVEFVNSGNAQSISLALQPNEMTLSVPPDSHAKHPGTT
jgi:hypothetical protein